MSESLKKVLVLDNVSAENIDIQSSGSHADDKRTVERKRGISGGVIPKSLRWGERTRSFGVLHILVFSCGNPVSGETVVGDDGWKSGAANRMELGRYEGREKQIGIRVKNSDERMDGPGHHEHSCLNDSRFAVLSVFQFAF